MNENKMSQSEEGFFAESEYFSLLRKFSSGIGIFVSMRRFFTVKEKAFPTNKFSQ
jgi:hypothetical protein